MIYYKPYILVSLIILAGCSSDNSSLNDYIRQVKLRHTKSVEPAPEFAVLAVSADILEANQRNPFKPGAPKEQTDAFAPEVRRVKQRLEAYSLQSLTFVGTLAQENHYWALIKSPDAHIIRIGVGDYMGQNYGRVQEIKNNAIIVEETKKSVLGAWEKRRITLQLYTGEQELTCAK